jgi:hypothetical protein
MIHGDGVPCKCEDCIEKNTNRDSRSAGRFGVDGAAVSRGSVGSRR